MITVIYDYNGEIYSSVDNICFSGSSMEQVAKMAILKEHINKVYDCAIKNNANDATISFSIIDEFHPLKEVLIDGVTDEQRKIIEAETYS